jgi:hypothetical protein
MSTYVLKNNETAGPFEDVEIQSALASGAFSYDDHGWREGMAEWQPLRTLYSPQPSAPRIPPAPAPTQDVNIKPKPTCQTCGQGVLIKRKKYRMSGPVVLIGYILLIPCVIGMFFGGMLLAASGSAGTTVSVATSKATRTRLETQAIPEPIIQKVVSLETITADDRSTLTPEQKSAVDAAKISLSANKIGAGMGALMGGGISIFLMVSCFVGGLLGWLLIMKKKVLQCNQCSAAVAAS